MSKRKAILGLGNRAAAAIAAALAAASWSAAWAAPKGTAKSAAMRLPAQTRSIETVLAIRTNLGFSSGHVIRVEGARVFFDGVELASTAVLVHAPALSVALSLPGELISSGHCAGGTYLHVVRGVAGGEAQKERGCLEDSRFAALFNAFEELKPLR